MIRDALKKLTQDQYNEIMEAFNDEISYIIKLDGGEYIAVHFTPDPRIYTEKDRTEYWSAGEYNEDK